MSTVMDLAEEKQTFTLGEFQVELPEPFFFLVKMKGRKFSDRELFEIDAANEDLRIETNAEGDFEIIPPPFPETSRKNWDIDIQLGIWAKKDKDGVCFDSSAKFTLPNGAKRMPDAAWILCERYFALSEVQRAEHFSRIAPDFVIELRSKPDRLKNLQNKMAEYIENGVRLGWLVDPYEKRVHIYRIDKTVEVLENPKTVSGEDVLKDFELDLTETW
jgi:Uma2 family endonuclease